MSDLTIKDIPLIEHIMDANRIPEGWQALLNEFLNHFNLKHINLYMLDSKFNILFQEWSGVQPTVQAIKEYMDNYFSDNKLHQTMLISPECKWITGNFEPYQTMLNNMPGYYKWAAENNFSYTTGCVLYRGQQGQIHVTFQRGEEQGPFTIEEENRFTLMSKYLSKAIELRVKFSDQDKNDLRLRSVLNKLRLPVSALNEFGSIIAHNNAMVDFLKYQDVLKIDKNQLRLSNNEHDKLMKQSIVKSVAYAKNIASTFNTDPSMIEVNVRNENFTIGTCGLSEKEDGGDRFVGALLYVVSPDLIKPASRSKIKNLFNLTNAEAQVCYFFAQNIPLKQIAFQESKSINTVREQLQNCYVKTNTANQLELINLLASLPLEN
jgi:DNA-binding CsgD family transcriptional regulator/PAS domain-containing protein